MEHNRPLCSVIVPTYNRQRLLRLTLASLARQTLQAEEFEVIVVDDGSSDGSEQAAAEFADRLAVRYLFQEDRGYRVAAARNLGLRHAAAEVCVFVDSGVMLHSGCLAAYLESHRASAAPVAVTGYVYCFNQDNEDGAQIEQAIDYGDPDTTMRRLRERGEWLDFREEFYAKYGDEFADLPAPWLVYWTCNVSAPTGLLRAVGGFDEAFRTWGGEDVDLAYRMHRAGARFLLNRDAAAIHVPHPKSHTANMASTEPNNRYIVEKYETPITRLVQGTHFFALNDLIKERDLPACADYLAAADPMAGAVLVFAAHPRDEALACGGTVGRKRGQGRPVGIALAADASDEAVAAARALGVEPDDLGFLGGDGGTEAHSADAYRTAIGKLLADRPDVTEVYIPHDAKEPDSKRRMIGALVTESLAALGLTPTVYRYVVAESDVATPPVPADRDIDRSDPSRTPERLVSRDIAPNLAAKSAALAAYGRPMTSGARQLGQQLEDFWVDQP
jgi:glycosyltransferase involved in cell wall biosynthesis/LmbE family N-acetylglucosaminyl deacetylase